MIFIRVKIFFTHGKGNFIREKEVFLRADVKF